MFQNLFHGIYKICKIDNEDQSSFTPNEAKRLGVKGEGRGGRRERGKGFKN
jgi:hypothetical protein